MTITITEFKRNFSKYLEVISAEDILLTKNGKIVAKLTKQEEKETLPEHEKIMILESLVGFAKKEK